MVETPTDSAFAHQLEDTLCRIRAEAFRSYITNRSVRPDAVDFAVNQAALIVLGRHQDHHVTMRPVDAAAAAG